MGLENIFTRCLDARVRASLNVRIDGSKGGRSWPILKPRRRRMSGPVWARWRPKRLGEASDDSV
ncbi:hypothetical protein ASG35_02485 [Burkholderia sp. Leaf177]|nr:hypothetical protein ASG35_02485 [Burkholderia sp. Leaf177]